MRLFNFSLLLSIFLFFSTVLGDLKSEVVVRAVNSMLRNYFAKNCAKVDLLYFGPIGGKSQTITERILQTKPDNVSIKYSAALKAGSTTFVQLETSSILFFESVKYFHRYLNTVVWMVRNGAWHKHLVYAPGLTSHQSDVDSGSEICFRSRRSIANSQLGKHVSNRWTIQTSWEKLFKISAYDVHGLEHDHPNLLPVEVV
jgi:hypothetical protein